MQYLTNDGQSSLFVSSHEGPPPPKAVITSVIKHEFRYKKDGILFTYHSFCFLKRRHELESLIALSVPIYISEKMYCRIHRNITAHYFSQQGTNNKVRP